MNVQPDNIRFLDILNPGNLFDGWQRYISSIFLWDFMKKSFKWNNFWNYFYAVAPLSKSRFILNETVSSFIRGVNKFKFEISLDYGFGTCRHVYVDIAIFHFKVLNFETLVLLCEKICLLSNYFEFWFWILRRILFL